MSSETDDVPYTKLAFHNSTNYLALAAAGALSFLGFATFGAAPLVVFLGLEALWLTVGCRSGSPRRYFDFVHRIDQKKLEEIPRQKLLANLVEDDRKRYLELEHIRKAIADQVEQNPSLHMSLVKEELEKLEKLADAFLQIASNAGRYEAFVREQDIDDIEAEVHVQEALVQRPGDDEQRRLAVKNLEVLKKRLEKAAEIRRQIRTSRAQLNLLENTLRLLRDQIVTMSSPRELSGQLEELTFAMDAIEASGEETEALMRRIEAGRISVGTSR